MSYFFLIFITILILQRLSELLLARRNENYVKAKGAKEYDPSGYKVIVLMHIAFIISFHSRIYFILTQFKSILDTPTIITPSYSNSKILGYILIRVFLEHKDTYSPWKQLDNQRSV